MLHFCYMKKSSSFRHVAVYVLAALVIIESAVLLFGSYVEKAFAPTVSSSDDTVSWQTVNIGGIVTFEIPKDCTLDSGAGTHYLICPTADNAQPTPEMKFSSDGITVNVRRWEGLESPYWNHIVGSLKIVEPMTHDITINVEK